MLDRSEYVVAVRDPSPRTISHRLKPSIDSYQLSEWGNLLAGREGTSPTTTSSSYDLPTPTSVNLIRHSPSKLASSCSIDGNLLSPRLQSALHIDNDPSY